MPCPHHSRNDRHANHSLENCYDLQRWKNTGTGNRNNEGNDRGGTGGGPRNRSGPGNGAQPGNNAGAGNGGGQPSGPQTGFQQNPRKLNQGQYHVFTTSSSRREKNLKHRAINAVAPALPRWLKWSEQPMTWSRADHPPIVENPRLLALVVAPQVKGYVLQKVLRDSDSSINILYYETFKRMERLDK